MDPKKLQPEEYLDRYGISTHLKDIVTLLLENRPDKPVEFVSEYFRNAIHGSSPLMRSYHFVRLTRQSRSAFMHNLVSSYTALQSKSGSVGLTGTDFAKLVKALCYDFPSQHMDSILSVLQKHEDDILSFNEFVSGVRVCLLFEEFLNKSEELFQSMDPENTGKVRTSSLIEALKSSEPAATHRHDGIMGVYNTDRDTPALASYHTILGGVLATEQHSPSYISEDSKTQAPLQDGLINAILEVTRNKEGVSSASVGDNLYMKHRDFASCVFKAASSVPVPDQVS